MSFHAGNGRISTDFLIVGAGIVGLALAREIRRRFPDAHVVIVEKESSVGRHASGRNSGVLHSGIYYPEGSLKFRICADGARRMAEYCQQHRLPIERVGKLVLAASAEQEAMLPLFLDRARSLGVRAESVTPEQTHRIEPEARAVAGIHLPDIAVIQGKTVLRSLVEELSSGDKVTWLFERRVLEIREEQSWLRTERERIDFRMLINAAGAHVDRIAHACGVGGAYVMLPFRGSYFSLDPASGLGIRGLIYPVPDTRIPFLGIHFTRSVDGVVYVGPSAFPAFGREHYQGMEGLEWRESGRLTIRLARLFLENPQGFRNHVRRELGQLWRAGFSQAAASLVPRLRPEHLVVSHKVGIRPQLYNRIENRLEMDFMVASGQRSIHVLNSISPAFTSAFSFAEW
ncbi:MAG: L-2-hydroxyglutarate oxidase, partial [Magnetococcales bacterium]|nr:L-2-hydroxyglutarate oxidase [Magnetococcales bacterium]